MLFSEDFEKLLFVEDQAEAASATDTTVTAAVEDLKLVADAEPTAAVEEVEPVPILDMPPGGPPGDEYAGTHPGPGKDLVGQTVGSYEVIEKIGQGGMAVVYKGFHPALQRDVAIKVLAGDVADTPALARRFQQEARTVAALRHPNIVQIHDFGAFNSTRYLIMEFVEGADLRAAMKLRTFAKQPWSPDEMLELLGQVGDALDYAHEQGVIHRDVKPANVLITTDGQPILTDFGLSALRKTRSTLISTLGQPFGTPEYVSPEQAMDYHSAGPPSDLYALTCILYEMITNHLPFESESPLSLALMHISQDPIRPRTYAPDLPQGVEDVILRMLDKEPEKRYPTAYAMLEVLRQAWTTTTINIRSPKADSTNLPATTRPEKEPSRTDSTDTVELTLEEAGMVLWAVEENDSRLSAPNIQAYLGLSPHFARKLARKWVDADLLAVAARRQPYIVTDELACQAQERVNEENDRDL